MKLLGTLILGVLLMTGVSFLAEVSIPHEHDKQGLMVSHEAPSFMSSAHAQDAAGEVVTSETIKSDPAKALGLSKIIDSAKWVLAHAPDVLSGLLALLVALGAVIEALTRLIPTEGGKSALAKVGEILIMVGGWIQKIMDFLKIPNVKK